VAQFLKGRISNMQPLLKPEEVAELLQLSLSTIYSKARNLGGFYPVGIKALRFRRETIHAIMEGPQDRHVEVPVSIPGQTLQQNRAFNQKRRPAGNGKSPRAADQEPVSSDPSIIADSMRFGLRDPDG
jgi:predicted DNA-binding transcriptional regulator AlpA